MALPAVTAPPQPLATAAVSDTALFDERWAAWRAKGDALDRASRRQMAIALPILVALAVGILYVLGR